MKRGKLMLTVLVVLAMLFASCSSNLSEGDAEGGSSAKTVSVYLGVDVEDTCNKIYEKITTKAKDLVKVGDEITSMYGIPIVNKRVSVTPIALVGSSVCKTTDDFVEIAKTLDKAAHTVGVNFLGGYS